MASTESSEKAAAIALKNKGNTAFAAHDWPTAVEYYTKAIEKYDKEPSFFCNRAQANLKLEAYGYSIADATKAIELDPGYVKVGRMNDFRKACGLSDMFHRLIIDERLRTQRS